MLRQILNAEEIRNVIALQLILIHDEFPLLIILMALAFKIALHVAVLKGHGLPLYVSWNRDWFQEFYGDASLLS